MNSQNMRNPVKTFLFLAIFTGLFGGQAIFGQQPATVTLDFNSLQNNEIPREYYNGGFGSLGSGPGPSYSISFGGNEVGGDSGQIKFGFTTPLLRNTVGRDVAINIPAGVTKVTYQYSQPEDDANSSTVTYAYTGINRTGQEIIRVQRPRTSAASGYDADAQAVTTLEFSTPARTIIFAGPADRLTLDNITFYFANSPTTGSLNRVGDFDGDRRADASVFRGGTWYIKPSGTTNNNPYGVRFGLATDKITPADFDGDGKTDIAVWREGSLAYFYILNSLTNTVRTEQFGTTGDSPIAVGDWDGDGKADPAIYRGSGQQSFYYRPSSMPAIDFEIIYWGIDGDKPVRGDFDGDGKLDAAIFRPSENTWYIRQSSNNQTRYDVWGTATDKFVPGDFDGDGKTDLTVVRNGVWYIKQSSNNQPLYKNFGTASDALAPGDYDGDGKTDVAVFRDGVLYILNANNVALTIRFGTTGDVPTESAYVQ